MRFARTALGSAKAFLSPSSQAPPPATLKSVSRMRIRSVQAHLLSYPLPEPLKLSHYGGERTIVKRDAMLIRVETEDGLTGYGPAPGTEHARNTDANNAQTVMRAPPYREHVLRRWRSWSVSSPY